MKKEFVKRVISSLIMIPIAFFFITKGNTFFMFFLSILFFITSYEWVKMTKKKSIKFTGAIYLLFSFYFAYLLRENLGLKIFLFIIIICISTDIGGYIFGKIFKGPKLTKISPKKTYAGALGGFVLSLIVGLIFDIKIYPDYDLEFDIVSSSLFSNLSLNTHVIFVTFILIVSFISQIGDLIISFFKRLSKVKNTGKLLPGHGGLLDRIDGIIFAIPISYLIFNF